MRLSLFLGSFVALLVCAEDLSPPSSIASQYQLTSSTSFSFPTATLSPSDASTFLTSQSAWQITKNGRIGQPGDVSFTPDPLYNASAAANPSGSAPPVFTVDYPAGSYSNSTGGTEFSTYWNDSSTTGFRTVLLAYEVAFDAGFEFVKGGKLPGLRGGPDLDACSGGQLPTDCFSVRFMWRTGGKGEAYGYIPTPNGLCKNSQVKCNSDFGTSLGRGSFSFIPGVWNNVSMLVSLNDPINIANGQVMVHYNGVLAMQFNDLQLRQSTAVTSISGLFFSTFFGGSDSSWASPKDQHTYFRNIQMWGSGSASTLAGKQVSSAMSLRTPSGILASGVVAVCVLMALSLSC